MSTAAMTHRLELPSLADAALKAAARFWFVDDGNKPQAITNYRKSLELNPKNGNAVLRLQKLK